METKKVTLMIYSTFYDMFGEYYCFLNSVYPKLKETCKKHDIELDYKEVAYTLNKDRSDKNIILEDLRSIDFDRTFFICFRGQRLGWKPRHDSVNRFTLLEYPELIKYVGNVSIMELSIMHALIPFEKLVDNEIEELEPIKHSLFYFRNPDYLDDLNDVQKDYYDNESKDNERQVKRLELAKAKDLIFDIKREFAKIENGPRVSIKHYDAEWNPDLNAHDMLVKVTEAYSEISGKPLDEFIKIHEPYLCEDPNGGLNNFTYEGRPLKDVIYDDILRELKLEFPDNFQ